MPAPLSVLILRFPSRVEIMTPIVPSDAGINEQIDGRASESAEKLGHTGPIVGQFVARRPFPVFRGPTLVDVPVGYISAVGQKERDDTVSLSLSLSLSRSAGAIKFAQGLEYVLQQPRSSNVYI